MLLLGWKRVLSQITIKLPCPQCSDLEPVIRSSLLMQTMSTQVENRNTIYYTNT